MAVTDEYLVIVREECVLEPLIKDDLIECDFTVRPYLNLVIFPRCEYNLFL